MLKAVHQSGLIVRNSQSTRLAHAASTSGKRGYQKESLLCAAQPMCSVKTREVARNGRYSLQTAAGSTHSSALSTPASSILGGAQTARLNSARTLSNQPDRTQATRDTAIKTFAKASHQRVEHSYSDILRDNGAIGAGIASGLGLMIFAWLLNESTGKQSETIEMPDVTLKEEDLDLDEDYDDEDEEEVSKYHLNYQLSDKIYDDITLNDDLPVTFEGGRAALERAIFDEDTRYCSARDALIQHAAPSTLKVPNKTHFENRLIDTIAAYQHNCFLKGIPWEEAMPIVMERLSGTLLKEDRYAIESSVLAYATMCTELKKVHYSVHTYGGRFVAHERSSHPLAVRDQIRANSGKIYSILRVLNQEDSEALFEQHGIRAIGDFQLGEGNFGTVYLAQDMDTERVVAVKELFGRHLAEKEIQQFEGIPPDDHLVSLFDFAHVRNSQEENMSLLFMELVGDVNGVAIVKALEKKRRLGDSTAADKMLTQVILECSVATAKLHELGKFHCDIKPENFFVSFTSIHLGDYGHTTRDRKECRGTSKQYDPKDKEYDAEMLDSFALGTTFYEFMHGPLPDPLPGKPIEPGPKTKDTDKLAGNTLAECVAKLRDEDPKKRITPREFVQLPYIQSLMNEHQRAAIRELILVKKSG